MNQIKHLGLKGKCPLIVLLGLANLEAQFCGVFSLSLIHILDQPAVEEDDKTKRTPGRSDAEEEDTRTGAPIARGGLHVRRT